MERKLRCILGIHKYDGKNVPMFFLRDEGNKSVVRLDYKCQLCGKTSGELVKFPRL